MSSVMTPPASYVAVGGLRVHPALAKVVEQDLGLIRGQSLGVLSKLATGEVVDRPASRSEL